MAEEGFQRLPSDPIGQSFGPYKLVRRLGVGGMAETFEAIRTGPSGFSQRVCLKLVLPFFRDSPDFIELFEREARLAAKLRHSNIVGVIDFGQIGGTSYMALELIDGLDLQALLDVQPARRLPPEYVALLGHTLAGALEHAHNPPPSSDANASDVTAIIHRDISPSNVLISKHGEIFLTDFGVAKAVTGTSHKQSAVKGKVPYMSPEQLRAHVIDGRADLFALGVVLFEALSGQRPYEGPHDPATIMLILEGNHPPLQKLCPDAPPGLCKVIESLIEADRDKRPASAAALIELLDEFVGSPRIGRELGTMVAANRRKEPPPPTAGRVASDDSANLQFDDTRDETGIKVTGRAGRADASAATVPSGPRSERKRALWLTALVLMVAAGLVVATLFWPAAVPTPTAVPTTAPTPTTASTPEPTAAPAPEAAPEAIPDATGAAETQGEEDTSAAQSGDTAKDARPAPALPKPARLTVVVFPWGDVWINGKAQGPAPLKDHALKPGRYQIDAGQGIPTKTRTVRLNPGQQQTVSFDLTH
jgi:serine/threonine protein kinase